MVRRSDRGSSPQRPRDAAFPRTRLAQWAVILILAAAAYANSTGGPFILDDHPTIAENTGIQHVWQREAFIPSVELSTARRPLVSLTFALNYALGGLDVRGYHIVNIALHAACALLVLALVRRTLLLPRLVETWGASANALACATAAMWAVHPLNTEAVNYITQRSELLMALCYLLTLYATARQWTAVAVAACAAGMACKEPMVTAPILALAYDAVFVSGSVTVALRNRPRLFAGLAASWLVLALVIWSGPPSTTTGSSADANTWRYLLNQADTLIRYLRQAVWPTSLVVLYGPPLPLTLEDVGPQSLVIIGLLILTTIALVKWPKVGFLGFAFFLILAPTSSLMPIATEVGAERRMYLPLIAVVLTAVLALYRIPVAWRVKAVTVAAVVVALLAGSLARNREYASPIVLARTVVERRPSPTAHQWLGEELLLAGQAAEALPHLRTAAAAVPRARYPLANALLKVGDANGAAGQLEAFLATNGAALEAVWARDALGDAYAAQGRWDEAMTQWRMALTMNPDAAQRTRLIARLADVSFQTERFADAAGYFETYLRLEPTNTNAWTNLGVALAQSGRLDDAIGAFRRAVELAPDNAGFERNLETALKDRIEARAR